MIKVFIDGEHGTTGLRIRERLEQRDDVELLNAPADMRKDAQTRKELISCADVAFLCLPDEAAIESAELASGSDTVIIDTSTAHRTNADWAYGFPELSPKHRENIKNGRRIAVPGCHACGVISLVYPLVSAGILPSDYPLNCFSVTGYSGGGKKMISEYECDEREFTLDSPRIYGLSQKHKHLPEIIKQCGLARTPVFMPVVADFYSGMAVSVPLYTDLLIGKQTASSVKKFFSDFYETPLVSVGDEEALCGFLPANGISGSDRMEIFVMGNDERILLVSRFDNLGKGASGAAIQCMNISKGLTETEGLAI